MHNLQEVGGTIPYVFVVEHRNEVLLLDQIPYWSRMWVVQEISVARSIAITSSGRILPEGMLLQEIIECLIGPGGMSQLLTVRFRRIPSTRLRLLKGFYKQKCQDPRDKIYALQNCF